MDFKTFLRERRVYIAVYCLFGLLLVAVVQLDLRVSGHTLQRSNLLYLLLLGLVGLLLFLAVDYRRQRTFFRHLNQVTGSEPLDELGILPDPVTQEQVLYREAWGRLYSRLRAELTAQQERHRQNLYLMSQWAHHMKTPVSVIDLELQKAHEPWPPQVESLLDSIAQENRRLQHSLQMLLNMVRLEEFAADFHVEQVDLVDLVRRLINNHKRAFITARVYPKVEAPPEGTLLVESDVKWLRFVLEQILSNAIKYTTRPDDQGRVLCRAYRKGDAAFLEVVDDGIGIAPEDAGRVFQPFFTGNTGRQYAQSTGMGLYLAQEICQRLGHTLRLQSQPGLGTRVILRFPDSHTTLAGVRDSLTGKVTKM